MPLDQKNQLVSNLMQKFKEYDGVEFEVVMDPFMLDIDLVQAIRIIQKNDRGRQGRMRILLIQRMQEQRAQKDELLRKMREGKLPQPNYENQQNECSVFIQKRIRGILGRKHVMEMRDEEMEFLGMVKKKPNKKDMENDPIKKMEQTRLERKAIQEGNWKAYEHAKERLKEEIDDNEGVDIMEGMLKQRRNWIADERIKKPGVVPSEIKPFYDKFKSNKDLTPDEIAAAKAADEEAKNAKKGKVKAKEKKSKKGKKGAAEDDGAPVKVLYGPTEVVGKFDDFYDNYNIDWI